MCKHFDTLLLMLLTSTNGGLMMGFLLGLIFCIVAITAFIHSIKKAIGTRESSKRNGYIACVMILPFAIYFLAQIPYNEYNLVYNYIWVDGKILDKCVQKGSHRAYEFEYYVEGKRYTSCNGAGETEGVKCPDGVYKVRVSKKVPSIGRIDFEQEVLK